MVLGKIIYTFSVLDHKREIYWSNQVTAKSERKLPFFLNQCPFEDFKNGAVKVSMVFSSLGSKTRNNNKVESIPIKIPTANSKTYRVGSL